MICPDLTTSEIFSVNLREFFQQNKNLIKNSTDENKLNF